MPLVSLNEVDATVRKAARGAGLTWGLAEEAGKAARWLAARGLPSLAPMAALLERNDGLPYAALRPVVANGDWSARGGALCPLIAGAALNDIAHEIAEGRSVVLDAVSHPLLLLPFLGRAATALERTLAVAWPGVAVRLRPDGPLIDALAPGALEIEEAERVAIAPAAAQAGDRPAARRIEAVAADPDVWARLERLAQRTYVPASEESRLRGAGAGLRDED